MFSFAFFFLIGWLSSNEDNFLEHKGLKDLNKRTTLKIFFYEKEDKSQILLIKLRLVLKVQENYTKSKHIERLRINRHTRTSQLG